jgi:membrane-associated phospholipid phosphatase
MRVLLMVTLATLLAAPMAHGETNPFALPKQYRAAAGRVSDGLVASALALDTWHSFRSDRRKAAFGCQALRMGLSMGVNVAVKNLVHRDRPDHSNRYSFYSGHSSNAMAASGWRYSVHVPIALATGAGRMMANKHYPSDVAVGLMAGWLSSRACRVVTS